MVKVKLTDFEQDLKNQLKNPKFKKYFDESGKQFEIAYQMNALRKKQKMSQSMLAQKLGTTQSNIARMEAGRQNFSLNTLVRLAEIFKKELIVKFN